MGETCKEKGYHGTSRFENGKQICQDCGETDFCSLCGAEAETYTTDLYDMEDEQICPECLNEEKPISDYLQTHTHDYNDRDYARSQIAHNEKIADLETQLLETRRELSERVTEIVAWEEAAKYQLEYDDRINKELDEKKQTLMHANYTLDAVLERETAANTRIAELEKAALAIARTVEELRQENAALKDAQC